MSNAIAVVPGGWGNADVTVLQDVFESTRDALADRVINPPDSNITVKYNTEGPEIKYERMADGSYEMWIDSKNNYWAQQIYQFAHEYGHILANYREAPNPQKWFEESISILASLYALETLSITWGQNPPRGYRKYQNFAGYLKIYKNKIVKRTAIVENGADGISPSLYNLQSLAWWYEENKEQLEKDMLVYYRLEPRNRQTLVAVMLFDIFEKYPDDAWNTVRYMNKGNPQVNKDFSSYMNNWRQHTPQRWQFIVDEIMSRFGIG